MKKNFLYIALIVTFLSSCGNQSDKADHHKAIQDSAQAFLDEYSKSYKELSYKGAEAEWKDPRLGARFARHAGVLCRRYPALP